MLGVFNGLEGGQTTTNNIFKQEFNNKNGKTTRKDYLNYGEDDQMEIQGFKSSKVKENIIKVLYFITLGLLRLLFHWYPHLHVIAKHQRCALMNADKVLIIDTYKKYKSYFVKKIEILKTPTESSYERNQKAIVFNLCDGRKKRMQEARIIRCKKLIYIWDDEIGQFFKLAGFDKGISRAELHAFSGQSREDQISKRMIYGNNEINVPVKTIPILIALEALTPFYIFQLFSLIIWLCEEYYYYTIALVILSCSGITTSIIQTRRNQRNLKGTVHSLDTATVLRNNGDFEEIPTTDLVPGDVIAIPSTGCAMQCDAVLIRGNCVANESMLTGESVPIIKTTLPNNLLPYKLKEDVNHTLFCGTKIIQTRCKDGENVLAVVIRTGYLTAKGELVRSILYPPPADFKFETDSYKFIGLLALIAFMGVIYTIVSKSLRDIKATDILIKALDVITIAVPPALPAAMTVGKLYALNRLKKSEIYCINSRVINVSGSVDCICFDKTGTLTEDELDMWGVVPIMENEEIKDALKNVKSLPKESKLLQGMASCHSLSIINDELGGDPLDIKMFDVTDWRLLISDSDIHTNKSSSIIVKPKTCEDNFELCILKQFHFSSNLQRMSVILKSSNSLKYEAYCKGSPETIADLCRPSSVPENFSNILDNYTSQGYRVIALAHKELSSLEWRDVDKLHREDVECNLHLLGLIVLENKLKPQTPDAIKTLRAAEMKVVMITGDNIQTAVHVAKECKMVDPDQMIVEVFATEPSKANEQAGVRFQTMHSPSLENECNGSSCSVKDVEKCMDRKYCFAIKGNSWANVVAYFPELIPKIITKGTIFARMTGMQKQQLVEELKSLGYYVAMCGDGANDCGALKAAHVGISLSEAESSVASPFTYKRHNISCMPMVIKEGRAALTTSIGVFKQMLCSSLLQFASVILLYNIDANLTSFQFLFIDLCLVLNLVSVFGDTKAYKTLYKIPPRISLMGLIPIASVAFFLVLATGFQAFADYFITTQQWFEPFVYNEHDRLNYYSYENYIIFTTSIFQYSIMVIVFSKGKPYRQPLYTNVLLTISLVLTNALCVYITLHPAEWLRQLLELRMPPIEIRYFVIVLALVCLAACCFAEDFIVDYLLGKMIEPKLKRFKESQKKFIKVLKVIEHDPSWPYMENKGNVNNGFVGSQNVLTSRM